MLGFLYYVTYKESNTSDLLLASKRLNKKSLNLDNSCVRLRAATFFLTNLEFSQSIEICDTFLIFPPRHELNSEYINAIGDKMLEQLFKVKTTKEMENIVKAILPMVYSSVKLKFMPGNYDITQQNHVWIFRNFTNIFYHDVYMDVFL